MFLLKVQRRNTGIRKFIKTDKMEKCKTLNTQVYLMGKEVENSTLEQKGRENKEKYDKFRKITKFQFSLILV